MKTLVAWLSGSIAAGTIAVNGQTASSFVNFETAPVHPVALSPNANALAVCNLPEGRVELFDVSGGRPRPMGDVPVGIDPVSLSVIPDHPIGATIVNFISVPRRQYQLQFKDRIDALWVDGFRTDSWGWEQQLTDYQFRDSPQRFYRVKGPE